LITSKLVLRDAQLAFLESSFGICNDQIIGPHFFERTINSPIYLDFLQNNLLIYFEDILLDVR